MKGGTQNKDEGGRHIIRVKGETQNKGDGGAQNKGEGKHRHSRKHKQQNILQGHERTVESDLGTKQKQKNSKLSRRKTGARKR